MATTLLSRITGQAQVVPVIGPTIFPTLVIGASSSAPTMGTNTNSYSAMQYGEKLEMSLTYFQNGAGTAGTGVYVFPLPPGRTVSVLECPVSHYNGSGLGVVGECEFWDGTKLYEGTVHVFNATNLYCTIGNEVTTPTQMSSSTFSMASANWRLSFKARFLCTEFVGNGYVAQGAGLGLIDRPGLVAKRLSTLRTTPLIGATTAPNITVKQSRVDDFVNITFSPSGLVTKDGSAGRLQFIIDSAFAPTSDVYIVQYGVVNNVSLALVWLVQANGVVNMYGTIAGNNITASTTNCGWTTDLTLSWSIR